MENITQKEIVIEFFERNPKRDVKHPEVVDGATSEYQNRTGNVFRDPDRQIRKLHPAGILIKVGTGIYRYDPDFVENKELESFTEKQKKEILARDKFRCVQCGKGLQDGVRLEVDHIKPKDKGGKATIENGQVLCAPHNYKKKNYGQTETGKKMFIRLYEAAKNIGDDEIISFSAQVLDVFEKKMM